MGEKTGKKRKGGFLRRLPDIVAVCLFAAGFLILIYPAVANRWNARREEQLINTYESGVLALEETDYTALFKEASVYNARQALMPIPDAFAAGEQHTDSTYKELLNVGGDGVMGALEIPVIGIRIPIFHGTGKSELEQGAGHMEGSSLPAGGETEHVVLAAHRGLPSAALFTDLNLLKKGDRFYLHILNREFVYEVDRIEDVEPHETGSLAVEPGKSYVSLVTCTPYGINTRRLIVRGHRIEPKAEPGEKQEERAVKSFATNYTLMVVLGLAIVALTALAVYLGYRRGNRIKREE